MSIETIVWSGRPSQLRNLGYFVVCGLLFFLVVPLFLILWRYLQTRSTRYELTNERLITSSGVLNRTTDQLELYRVRDYRQEQPFLLRLVGLSNVTLVSTDRSTNTVMLSAVPRGAEFVAQARQSVENLRGRKARIV